MNYIDRKMLRKYHKGVRRIACSVMSPHLGIDSTEYRLQLSRLIREIREEYPISQFKRQWGAA